MSANEFVLSPTRSKKFGPLLILAVFAIGVLFPIVGMMLGWSGGVVALELRVAAPLPGMPGTIEELEAMPSEVDAFLDDHFGFRTQLLGLNSRLYVAAGVSPTTKFLIGKNGWLFQRTIDGVLDQYRGMDRFTARDLERWVQTMERNQRWLAERGIRMLIAVAPSKHAIYSEYLPDWANVVHKTGRYRQLMARLAKGSSLEMVDLHTALRKAKREYRVYHKTDAHWNELGAHVAYTAIIERIRESHPEVPLRSLDDYDLDWLPQGSGSMTVRLNIAESMPEVIPRLRLKTASSVIRTDWPDGAPTGLLDMIHLTQIIESDLPTQPNVVFVRDSFATSIARFAQESFRRTALVHHGYGGFRRGLVMSLDPDIVVYEITERGLSWRLRIEP